MGSIVVLCYSVRNSLYKAGLLKCLYNFVQLVGALTRSDGECYVPRQDSSGLPVDYQMWDVFDYPSLGQVQSKLIENDIVLIIAAIFPLQPTYQVGHLEFLWCPWCLVVMSVIGCL